MNVLSKILSAEDSKKEDSLKILIPIISFL